MKCFRESDDSSPNSTLALPKKNVEMESSPRSGQSNNFESNSHYNLSSIPRQDSLVQNFDEEALRVISVMDPWTQRELHFQGYKISIDFTRDPPISMRCADPDQS